ERSAKNPQRPSEVERASGSTPTAHARRPQPTFTFRNQPGGTPRQRSREQAGCQSPVSPVRERFSEPPSCPIFSLTPDRRAGQLPPKGLHFFRGKEWGEVFWRVTSYQMAKTSSKSKQSFVAVPEGKPKPIDIERLEFDPENPRTVERLGKDASQGKIEEFLLGGEMKALDLVQSFITNGYIPYEPMIVKHG